MTGKVKKVLKRFDITYPPGLVHFFRWAIAKYQDEYKTEVDTFSACSKNKAFLRELKRHRVSLDAFKRYGSVSYHGGAAGTKGELFFYMHGMERPFFIICHMGINGVDPGEGQTEVFYYKSVNFKRKRYWKNWAFCSCGHECTQFGTELGDHMDDHKINKERFVINKNISFGRVLREHYNYAKGGSGLYLRSIENRTVTAEGLYLKRLERLK